MSYKFTKEELEHLLVDYNRIALEEQNLDIPSEVCEKYFNQPLALNKPIVGDHAFAYESGLHIAAILAHPLIYKPINPSMVGGRRKFSLGKFSGSKSILHALQKKN